MVNEYSGVHGQLQMQQELMRQENTSWNDRKKSGPVGELRKVRVGDIGRKTIKQYWHEVYNGTQPVHDNKFDEYMYNDDFHKYDWESLKTSLLDNGYDINKYSPITVRPSHEEYKYFIIEHDDAIIET